MPAFKSSPNGNTFFSSPYFKALSENKDTTFSPRFYGTDKFLLQNEFRAVNKNSRLDTDISILADKKTEIYFFLNYNKNLNINSFNKTDINLKLQKASNDTYLKANKITSPLLENYDLLENSLKLKMSSNTTDITSEVIIFEKPNQESSDKYEYILPSFEITKIENRTGLDGNFEIRQIILFTITTQIFLKE